MAWWFRVWMLIVGAKIAPIAGIGSSGAIGAAFGGETVLASAVPLPMT
jgi:hypothetical protein